MLGVGIVGAQFLGYIQDTSVEQSLQKKEPGLHTRLVDKKDWILGSYRALDPNKATAASALATDSVSVKNMVRPISRSSSMQIRPRSRLSRHWPPIRPTRR